MTGGEGEKKKSSIKPSLGIEARIQLFEKKYFESVIRLEI